MPLALQGSAQGQGTGQTAVGRGGDYDDCFSFTAARRSRLLSVDDTRALQAWLGHKNIQHTVRYTELAPERFKDFWR